MKKIFKGIAILFAVISLAGCASSKVAGSSNPGKITVNGLNVNGKEFGAKATSSNAKSGELVAKATSVGKGNKSRATAKPAGEGAV